MRNIFRLTAVLGAVMAFHAGAAGQVAQLSLVPQPVEVKPAKGAFHFDGKTEILYPPQFSQEIAYLKQYLPSATYVEASGKAKAKGRLVFTFDGGADIPEDGYLMDVSRKGVSIKAKGGEGAFYAIQTLLQLFPPEVYAKGFTAEADLPAVRVKDYPKYGYRGMMLDVVRTFFTQREVERFLDLMAYHKLNRFHWHLSDDQGWRIEIKGHPELTQVGGFRGGDSPIKPAFGYEDEKYGGYFTQEQVREIVEYAKARHIEIIPEIDLPGHSTAAGAVYPEILCPTEEGWKDVWCAAREGNYRLLEDIIAEMSELFPYELFCLGGDEVRMRQWESCPDCQALAKRENLENGHQIEGWFMGRMSQILKKYGKTMTVWNEAVEGGNLLDKSTVVHGWKNATAALNAARAGYPTIIEDQWALYLDRWQADGELGARWSPPSDTKDIYDYGIDWTPDDAKRGEEYSKAASAIFDEPSVIGFEAPFWAETVLPGRLEQGPHYPDCLIWPRSCALSERAWGTRTDWEDFRSRLENGHLARLKTLDVDYRPL